MERSHEDMVAFVARCRELAAPVVVRGLEGAPGALVTLRPRGPGRVDIDLRGTAPGGQAFDHATGLVLCRTGDAAVTDPEGRAWSWGNFMEDRDRPDLTEDPVTHAGNGLTEAEADRLCAALAEMGARFATENPAALKAAGVVAAAGALSHHTREEAALRRKADETAALLPGLADRLEAAATEFEALLDEAPAPMAP